MGYKWHKVLTRSDAQQKTLGAKMPFLRFTQSSAKAKNHTTWFRDTFFDSLHWTKSMSAKGHPIEEATVQMDVTILGKHLGKRTMRLDHDPARAGNHRAPTTHLHYDTKTRHELESGTKMAGHRVVVTRDDNDHYFLEVV